MAATHSRTEGTVPPNPACSHPFGWRALASLSIAILALLALTEEPHFAAVLSGERGGSAPSSSFPGAIHTPSTNSSPEGRGESVVQWIEAALTSPILVRVCTEWNRGAEVSAPK